jgi:hypothetical protein
MIHRTLSDCLRRSLSQQRAARNRFLAVPMGSRFD